MRLGDTNGCPTCSDLSPPHFSHLHSVSGAQSHCHTPPEIHAIFLFLFPQDSGLQMLTVACQNMPDLPRRQETLPSSRSLWEGTAPRTQGTRVPLRKQIRTLVAQATHHPPAELSQSWTPSLHHTGGLLPPTIPAPPFLLQPPPLDPWAPWMPLTLPHFSYIPLPCNHFGVQIPWRAGHQRPGSQLSGCLLCQSPDSHTQWLQPPPVP